MRRGPAPVQHVAEKKQEKKTILLFGGWHCVSDALSHDVGIALCWFVRLVFSFSYFGQPPRVQGGKLVEARNNSTGNHGATKFTTTCVDIQQASSKVYYACQGEILVIGRLDRKSVFRLFINQWRDRYKRFNESFSIIKWRISLNDYLLSLITEYKRLIYLTYSIGATRAACRATIVFSIHPKFSIFLHIHFQLK